MPKVPTRKQVWMARGIAVAADAIQIALFPFFAGGVPEGADAVLDLAVGGALCWLCGFHFAFLPTFIGEALPTVDLFPTWTLAVLYVTRRRGEGAPEVEARDASAPRLEADSSHPAPARPEGNGR